MTTNAHPCPDILENKCCLQAAAVATMSVAISFMNGLNISHKDLHEVDRQEEEDDLGNWVI